jgi:hypothetical protein
MAFLRKIFWYMRPRRKAPKGPGYDNEVLYAGWVQPTGVALKSKPRR